MKPTVHGSDSGQMKARNACARPDFHTVPTRRLHDGKSVLICEIVADKHGHASPEALVRKQIVNSRALADALSPDFDDSIPVECPHAGIRRHYLSDSFTTLMNGCRILSEMHGHCVELVLHPNVRQTGKRELYIGDQLGAQRLYDRDCQAAAGHAQLGAVRTDSDELSRSEVTIYIGQLSSCDDGDCIL